MNRPGKMNDNAHMESFFHSMKAEELYGKAFADDDQLRRTLSSCMTFYNQQRLLSSLRYLPPAAFEQRQGQQPCVNQSGASSRLPAGFACFQAPLKSTVRPQEDDDGPR